MLVTRWIDHMYHIASTMFHPKSCFIGGFRSSLDRRLVLKFFLVEPNEYTNEMVIENWTKANFYLQIERCAGVAKQSCSVRLEEDIRSLKIVRNILKSGGAFWHGKILARFSMQGALPSKGASIEGRDAETKIRYDEMVGEKKIECRF